jgi:hypothetical protein
MVGIAQVPYTAGDSDEAESRLRRLIDDPASTRGIQARADERLVQLLRIGGRYTEAERRTLARASAEGSTSRVHAFAALDRMLAELFVYGREDAALRQLAAFRHVVSDLPVGQGNIVLDGAMACGWMGDARCAREYMDGIGDRSALKAWSGSDLRLAHAALARAEGDRPRALQILRDVRTVNCMACRLPYMGRLFEEMNQPDSAAAMYEQYIATPDMDRIWTDWMLPPIHERLGHYYEARGDTGAASRHYAQFIEMWKAADPDLQVRVAAARVRLAGLQPDR